MAGNTTIQLKRSSVAGKQPTTGTLSIGELAINITDQKLYSSNGSAIFEPAGNVSSLTVSNSTVTGLNVNASVLTINTVVSANGSNGSAGQVLTTNSTGVYWSTVTGGAGGGDANVDAQYTWNNNHTYTYGANSIGLTNATSNWIYWNTAGTNAPTVTTRSAGTKLVLYPSLSGSTVDYAIGINAGTLWSSIPGYDAGQYFKWYGNTTEVASLSGTGNLVIAGSITSGNSSVFSTINTTAFSGTANDVYYVNGVTAVNVVSNSQLSANLANYTNTASFYLDTLQDVSAGGPTSGQILTWNSTTNQWTPQAPPTVVTGVTPGYYGSFYDANANQTISSTTSAYLIRVANTFEQNGITVVNNTDITFAYTGTYEIIYSIQFFNDDNAQQDINIWFYKNGNNNIGNSDSKFTVNGKSGSNKGKIIAVTPFISTFNAGDYVRLAWAATATGVAITTDPAGTAPTTPVVPGVIVTVKQVSNIISAPPGTNSQIMFNDSGVSNATAGFTFNKTTNNITIGNSLFVTTTVNAAALTVDNKFIANSTYVYSNGMYFSPLSGTPGNTASGSVFYDLNNHALNVYNDTSTPMELGLQTFARVYNSTGSTITKGTAVYIDGANSNRPTIAKAISNSTITQAKAVGVVFDDIAATSEGFVLTNGLLQNVDTRNYTAGQEIYISAVTAGALSNTEPSYPNYTAPIGYALNSALVGQIYISTENPSINLPNTSIYISNGTGPIVSNNFQYDYTNNVLKVGNSTTNATIGYVDTGGTTTFMKLDGVANASLDSVIVNYSTGTNSSSDFAAYDSSGPSSYNFIDMGISGVNFNQSYWTIGGASDGYLYTGNSALTIGTAQAFPLKFFTGDTLAANERMRISATGNVGIGNTNPQDTLSVSGTSYLGGNVVITGNLIVSGTTVSVNTTTLDVKDKNITLAKGAIEAATDGAGITIDTVGVGLYYSLGSNTWQSNVGITPSANVTFDLGTAGLSWSNVYANTIKAINLYGTLQTSSQPNITANNATYLNGVASASYVQNTDSRTLSGNIYFTGTNNYFDTAINIGANVYANTTHLFVGNSTVNATHESAQIQVANASQYANLNAGILYVGNSGTSATVNSTIYTGTAWTSNNSSNLNGKTESNLNVNSSLTANSSTYLGTVAAASYVQNTESRVLSGNLNFSGANNYFNTAVYVGANISINTSVIAIGNSSVNTSINSTVFSGTANNANYLGTVAAANYVQNTDSRTLSGNINFTGTNVYFTSAAYIGDNVDITTTSLLIGNSTVNTALTASAFTINATALVANGTGLWTTGTVNAASHSVGSSFIANTSQVTISGIPISANGSTGTATNVLTSNGATGAPYWAPAVAVVNTDATYTWTNTHVFTNATSSGNATSGAIRVTGGVGIANNLYVGGRVGWSNATNISTVYTYYNAATNSLDTVFG